MGTTRETDESGPAYWSSTPGQKPVKSMKPHNSNPVYRIPDPPRNGRLTSSTPSLTLSTWRFGDAEMKRKKRISSYKAYAIEGKVKASLRSSFRWVKNKYSSIVHGCN
ncbi:unnamed protein product [Ilex paraguariensis]|uniref:DUF3511 domain protein n=1 Tax=Ilex paraguariensis TaxID=185542 RepID=A0ABC8R8G1_9AQUA